jgi:hypothetical protein
MNEQEQTKSKKEISWTAPEFIRYEKGPAWFLWLFIISGIFFAIAILMKSYIFSLIIFLAAFSLYIQAQKKPRKIKFIINKKGVLTGSELHPWENLNSFWIFEDEEKKYISFESKKILRPRLNIPLDGQEIAAIRDALESFIREKKYEESMLDILARRLKY